MNKIGKRFSENEKHTSPKIIYYIFLVNSNLSPMLYRLLVNVLVSIMQSGLISASG